MYPPLQVVRCRCAGVTWPLVLVLLRGPKFECHLTKNGDSERTSKHLGATVFKDIQNVIVTSCRFMENNQGPGKQLSLNR